MPDALPTINSAAEEYPVTLPDTLPSIHALNAALKALHRRLTELTAKTNLDDPGEQRSLEDACRELLDATKSLDVLP